jgi:hypothetical protein
MNGKQREATFVVSLTTTRNEEDLKDVLEEDNELSRAYILHEEDRKVMKSWGEE